MGGVLGALLGSFPSGPAPAFEQIATTVVSGTSTSITFSSIPQGYKHLQIRTTYRSASGTYIMLRFNSDSATSYSRHDMFANGSSLGASAQANSNMIAVSTAADSNFGAAVVDILDYTSTAKNKTVRSFTGALGGFNQIRLQSGAWRNTSAVTSISLVTQNDAFAIGSRFSLYGIKG